MHQRHVKRFFYKNNAYNDKWNSAVLTPNAWHFYWEVNFLINAFFVSNAL